jgi:hypothetical protein
MNDNEIPTTHQHVVRRRDKGLAVAGHTNYPLQHHGLCRSELPAQVHPKSLQSHSGTD